MMPVIGLIISHVVVVLCPLGKNCTLLAGSINNKGVEPKVETEWKIAFDRENVIIRNRREEKEMKVPCSLSDL